MPDTTDPYDLARFVRAQDGVYEKALAEMRQGQKRTHWMWFIFPQLEGLGSSPTAQRYAIRSADEARAYLAHPVLGARLLECVQALLALQDATAAEVFGFPDDMKLRSCATLFGTISPDRSVFPQMLAKYFPNGPDDATLRLLDAR